MNKHFIALATVLALATATFANTTYTVKSGDNDHTIAAHFGITVKQLHEKNPGIDWSKLQIGSKLTIPVKTKKTETGAARSAATQQYVVRAGDNSWTISRQFGISEQRLKDLNPGVSFSPLAIGTKLNVPARGATTAPTATRPATPAAAPAPAPANKFPVIRTENAVTKTDAVIVRGAPSTSAKRLTTVGKFTIGKIVERRGDWYKLKFSWGGAGWIRGDLLQETNKEVPRATAQPAARPATTTRSAATRQPSGSINSLLSTARSQLGVRYVWGGTSRRGFDCSGFVSYVFRQHGISLPRTSAVQATVGTPVSRGNLQPGDLVFFRTRGSRISHVGIWLGNNQFIHASSGGGRIRIDRLAGYYSARYVTARRVTSKLASITPSSFDEIEYEVGSSLPDPEPLPESSGPRTNLGADIIAR